MQGDRVDRRRVAEGAIAGSTKDGRSGRVIVLEGLRVERI